MSSDWRPGRQDKFDAIRTMEATDDERVVAYIELCREDDKILREEYARTKLLAPDGTLHDIPPLPPFPFPEKAA